MRSLFLGSALLLAVGILGVHAQDGITDAEWTFRSTNAVAHHPSFRNVHVGTTIFSEPSELVILVLVGGKGAFVGEHGKAQSCLVDFHQSDRAIVEALTKFREVSVRVSNPLPPDLTKLIKSALSTSSTKEGCYMRLQSCEGARAATVSFRAPGEGWQPGAILSETSTIAVSRLLLGDNSRDLQEMGVCALLKGKASTAHVVGVERALASVGSDRVLLAWRQSPRACLVSGTICGRDKIVERLGDHSLAQRVKAATQSEFDSLFVGETGHAPDKDDLAGYSLCKLATTGCGP